MYSAAQAHVSIRVELVGLQLVWVYLFMLHLPLSSQCRAPLGSITAPEVRLKTGCLRCLLLTWTQTCLTELLQPGMSDPSI